ncbi:alpha-E domain-containing protein [Luteolibacter algae]|uniref:Alpha-E domain-containing protein n=1 Tax=Luteolibacter algae TaxID=454151 RepID=A0ABW5DBW5_9BACT
MLSRVANTLYWMVRFVERADNLARLIDVNQQLLLDFESLDSARLRGFWQPIILSTGDEEAFNKLYSENGSREVIRFLTDDPRNPNSIVSCIALARENARTVRDQLSDELWEELNSLYLFTRSAEASRLIDSDPSRFYDQIRRCAVTFLGIAESTTSRNEAWEFMDLGRHLERADKTTRFLDVSSYLPSEEESPETVSAVVLHWTAILRSCGAMGAYRAEKKREINASGVTDFLMFSKEFPRSVRYCIEKVDISLHRVSGTPRGTFSNQAERESGRLLSELNFGCTDGIFESGLHQYLDNIQIHLNHIGDEIFETYVLMPERMQTSPVPKAPTLLDVATWQMEQQQQQ